MGISRVQTAAYIKAQLKEAGISVRDVTETGFIAELKGTEDGPPRWACAQT